MGLNVRNVLLYQNLKKKDETKMFFFCKIFVNDFFGFQIRMKYE